MNAHEAALMYVAAACSTAAAELNTLLHACTGVSVEAFYEKFTELATTVVSGSVTNQTEMLCSVLSLVQLACGRLVPDELRAVNVYVRKTDAVGVLANIQHEVASRIGSYQSAFIPLSYIGSQFQRESYNATIVNIDGMLSQCFILKQDHRIMHIGTPPTSSFRSELPVHIRIIKEHDTVVIKEGPSTVPQTKVRLKANVKHLLRPGTMLRIGAALFCIHDVRQEKVMLRWKFDNQPYSPMIQFEASKKDRWLIGRQPDSDILLNDLMVSSHHALIEHEHGLWTISDLNSSNGCFRYLHTLSSLSSESDELLITDKEEVYFSESSLLRITLEPA